MPQKPRPRIVIVGGGFGGLQAARSLSGADADLTVIDRRNFHLFQPLLYQVASGTLSPANIASPIRSLLKHQANTRVLMAEATGIDVQRNMLEIGHEAVPFDFLIVAAGSQNQYFGHADWPHCALGLKNVEEAIAIRNRIYSAFEEAERTNEPQRRSQLLNFVIIGGGPTGVELAGALAEIARHTLRDEFKDIDTSLARITLIESSPQIIGGFSAAASSAAMASLVRLGVVVRLNAKVVSLSRDSVVIEVQGVQERLEAGTVLWAAGMHGASIGQVIATATHAGIDEKKRILVEPDCSIKDHPHIFILGDLANHRDGSGRSLPALAPVAIQQGRYVARVIRSRLAGRGIEAFRYRDHGSMATIGRRMAVADLGRLHLSGTIAWVAWLIIHLMSLVAFQNRLAVLMQWAYHYLTWNRHARLITDGIQEEVPRDGG